MCMDLCKDTGKAECCKSNNFKLVGEMKCFSVRLIGASSDTQIHSDKKCLVCNMVMVLGYKHISSSTLYTSPLICYALHFSLQKLVLLTNVKSSMFYSKTFYLCSVRDVFCYLCSN